MYYSKIVLSSLVVVGLLSGCGGSSEDTKSPVFKTTGTQSVIEGENSTVSLEATDDNDIVYTLAGGVDKNKFMINSVTGVLQFVTAPDFEQPSDSDKDGTYEVVVKATDSKGNSSTLPLSIQVTDNPDDNGPTFTSVKSITLQENKPLDFIVKAKPKSGDVLYSIEGDDSKLINIDSNSGKISFIGFRPDYDIPSDYDKNNHYEVTIKAIDDFQHVSFQHFSINVTDDPNDLVPSEYILKTGADDGIVKGLAYGIDRNFSVKNSDGERIIVARDRMWEDSPHSINNTVGFYEASNYCEGLNYGGYDDWRAPNRHELAEMLNYGNRGNMFDDVFKYKTGANYWTSQEKLSSGGNGSGLGWTISFENGGVHDKNKGDQYNIRCVRGKEITNHHDFNVDGDIVIDNKTGIMWQNAEFIGGRTWAEAKEHCKELVFSGYDDWRLPNVNEMRTIMPYDNNEILFEDLSPIGGGDLDSGHSWSSTPANKNHAYYNLNDWDEATNRDSLIVMFEEYDTNNNSDLMLNRCIRGGHL